MEDWILLPVFLLILVGEYAAILWLPALGADLWLVVREPKSRKVLLPLTAGCLLCILTLWGGPKLAEAYDLRLRSWLTTDPIWLLVLLSIALLVAYLVLMRRWQDSQPAPKAIPRLIRPGRFEDYAKSRGASFRREGAMIPRQERQAALPPDPPAQSPPPEESPKTGSPEPPETQNTSAPAAPEKEEP